MNRGKGLRFFLILAGSGAAFWIPVHAGSPPAHRQVAVTFDDLPLVSVPESDLDGDREVMARLIGAIRVPGIPAIGFVNESRLRNGPEAGSDPAPLLRMWLEAGLELGNHTFSHIDLHRTDPGRFQEEVLRGERVTRVLLEERGGNPRYFRHPFLHTGRDPETRREVETFLSEHGYAVAPVTIDNSDWIFARAYLKAAGKEDPRLKRRIVDAYIRYLDRKFAYFERQSRELFGYEMKQILLLHANLLNADHFDAVVRMMRGRGYRFVSLKEALRDPAYESSDDYTGAGGITWLHRWALTRGMDPSFFRGEPATPAFVLREAGVERE